MTCSPLVFGTFSLSFSYEIKLHVKRAEQTGMSLDIFILRIQLYIPSFPLFAYLWRVL